MSVDDVAACACTLGEGVLWDDAARVLWWVDIKGQAVFRLDPAGGKLDRWPVPEPVGFVFPRRDAPDLVAGLRSGLAVLDLSGREPAIEPLVDPEPTRPGNRVNDGFVDDAGRLWFGTMDDAEETPTGWLYVYDGATLRRTDGPYIVTNGPCIAPDGRTLYHTDTVDRAVWAFDLAADGTLTGRRPFVRFEDPAWGHPDGMAADAEGGVWICHWDGGRITRFTPDGAVDRVIGMPVSRVTKCAFGGPDLQTLYVTTARIGRADEPGAGNLFRLDAGVRGLPASRCSF